MSSKNVLSQDEIDALLNGVEGGRVAVAGGLHQADGEVIPFDFKEQEHLTRNQFPQLDLIGQRFVRSFESNLYRMFKRTLAVEADAVQLIKYAEYVDSIETPSSINLIRVHPLNGIGLIVMDPVLVFLAVDNYFGGDGRIQALPEKVEFSATERRVIQLLINLAFEDLRKAWAPLTDLEFEYLKCEVNPRFTAIVTPTELVTVSRFRVQLDGGSGELHLVLPLSMLEPVREQLEMGPMEKNPGDDERWLEHLRREILQAEVELNCVLFELPMTLGDLLRLQPGDVLSVELEEQVTVHAADTPLFGGRFGVVKGHNAVQIEEALELGADR